MFAKILYKLYKKKLLATPIILLNSLDIGSFARKSLVLEFFSNIRTHFDEINPEATGKQKNKAIKKRTHKEAFKTKTRKHKHNSHAEPKQHRGS